MVDERRPGGLLSRHERAALHPGGTKPAAQDQRHRAASASFGDGYAQELPDGINRPAAVDCLLAWLSGQVVRRPSRRARWTHSSGKHHAVTSSPSSAEAMDARMVNAACCQHDGNVHQDFDPATAVVVASRQHLHRGRRWNSRLLRAVRQRRCVYALPAHGRHLCRRRRPDG